MEVQFRNPFMVYFSRTAVFQMDLILLRKAKNRTDPGHLEKMVEYGYIGFLILQ